MTANLQLLQVLGWPYGDPNIDTSPIAGPSNVHKRDASPLLESPKKKRPTIIRADSIAKAVDQKMDE